MPDDTAENLGEAYASLEEAAAQGRLDRYNSDTTVDAWLDDPAFHPRADPWLYYSLGYIHAVAQCHEETVTNLLRSFEIGGRR